jgi:hypothetical protein
MIQIRLAIVYCQNLHAHFHFGKSMVVTLGSKLVTKSQKDYFGKGLQVFFPKKLFYMQMNF